MTRFLFLVLAMVGLGGAAAAEPEGLPLGPGHGFGRGRIGIQVHPMTPELREHMGAPEDAGVLVVRVEEGSPAAEAGVRVGDVVTRAGEERIEAPHALIQHVARVPEGERLALGLVRDGEKLELEVAPEGKSRPVPEAWEEWLGGGMRQGAEALEKRLEDLERRIRELEKRLPAAKPT